MTILLDPAKTYYDAHVARKLRDFVEGNERIERAWQTIDQWAPLNVRSILEIGCGIGDICWRMTRRWPEAKVVGLDISPKSLEIARKLFGSSRLSFCEGPLLKGKLADKCDLIVLMDVYEHIAVEDRPGLHEALADLLSDGSRIFLSFPTPRHLSWLKKYHAEEIQPVDEDVNIQTIAQLAHDTQSEVFLYQEIGIWHDGDYVHAVLGGRQKWTRLSRGAKSGRGRKDKIMDLLFGNAGGRVPPRSQRLKLIRKRLGRASYP